MPHLDIFQWRLTPLIQASTFLSTPAYISPHPDKGLHLPLNTSSIPRQGVLETLLPLYQLQDKFESSSRLKIWEITWSWHMLYTLHYSLQHTAHKQSVCNKLDDFVQMLSFIRMDLWQ